MSRQWYIPMRSRSVNEKLLFVFLCLFTIVAISIDETAKKKR